jgi:hypothetical protein
MKMFFNNIPSLPPKRKIAHTISLKEGHKAPFRLIYRLCLLEIEEAKGKIAEYIHKRWLEPSSSSNGSPILFIKKKDGGLTLVIDYRVLEKVTTMN